MNWTRRIASRTAHMKRSAIRELLKRTAQPGVISFAGGLPAAELFPIERVQDAARAVLARAGSKALQYGETEGLGELRDWIAARFSSATTTPLDRRNVVIVSGAQQGLDLLGRVLLDPGDRVAVENPTYLALLSAWRPLGVNFLPVACDESGMCIDSLCDALQQQPKVVYSIPTFQNPQGTTLSLERRHAMLKALCEFDVPLVEDSPYADLRYGGAELPSLFALDADSRPGGEGRVLHVGTFSKTLMPGLRVGFVVGPEHVIDKVVQAKQAADLHTSTFNQHIVFELVTSGFLDGHISILRGEYASRRDAMLSALAEAMPPGCTWTQPEGGMFVMVRLPGCMDAESLLSAALAQQVAFVPGGEFHLNGAGHNTLRLNFTSAPPDRIREGVHRLGRILGAVHAVGTA